MTNSLVDHACRELELCGQYDEDPAYAESIIRAVEAFASYGHSGGSASLAVEQLHRLLQWDTLSPLTDNPADWEDRTEESGTPLWQSTRNPAMFSADGGKTHYRPGAPSGTDHEPRYNITVEVDDQTIDFCKPIADPFHSTTVRIGWRDLLRGLLRRSLRVTVRLGADRDTIFKIMTLDKVVTDNGTAVPR